jgi:multisubunit Na+/H+ antiporter MnhE subunit
MRSILINLAVAIIWMLLQGSAAPIVFLTGWVVGFVLLALFRPIIGSGNYVRRAFGLAAFLVLFLRAFLASCWQLVVVSLFRPVRTLRPRLITYDVRGLTLAEILLLSHTISLTPGTTTVDVAADRSHLMLHVLDAADPESVRSEIDRTLRRGILAFTR